MTGEAGLGETGTAIRTRPNPDCALCGTGGEACYGRLTDRLFGAPGTWSLKQCPAAGCGLMWFDPMPIEDDIGRLYEIMVGR